MNLALWGQIVSLVGFLVMSGPVITAARHAHALHKLKQATRSGTPVPELVEAAENKLKNLRDDWTKWHSRALGCGLMLAIAGYALAIMDELQKEGICT